jgi:hypothetical protein
MPTEWIVSSSPAVILCWSLEAKLMFLNNRSGLATTVAAIILASPPKTNGRDYNGVQGISGGCASIPLKFKADCMVMVAAVMYRGAVQGADCYLPAMRIALLR